MSIYTPLFDQLSTSRSSAVTLSFREIETLLGRRLPESAKADHVKRQWWANTTTHSQARAWLRAGRKAKLDARRNEVTFIRDEALSGGASEAGSAFLIAKLSPGARRMLEDISESQSVSMEDAAVGFLEEMARRRRAATLEWFKGKSTFSDTSSADLLREDRDAR